MLFLVLSLMGVSSAQDATTGFDARGRHLAASDGDLKDPMIGWRPEAQRKGSFGFGGMLEYADQPLVRYINNRGTIEQEKLLDNLFGLNVMGSYGLHERVAVTAILPLWFTSVDEGGPQGIGLGDLRLSVPIGLVVPDEFDGGFGLSLVPLLDLPTGSQGQLLGNNSVSGGAIVAAGYGMKRWELDANAGVRQTPATRYENLRGGPQFLGSLAGALLVDDHHAIRAEGVLRSALSTSHPGYIQHSQSPAEALLSFRGRYDQGFNWTAGGAMGLNGGAGAAAFRLFAGAGYVVGKRPMEPVLTGRLTVSVVDGSGSSLSEAALLVDGEQVALDPDASYFVKELDVGEAIGLSATLQGYTPSKKMIEVEEGSNMVELVLNALPGQILVTVQDTDGEPVVARVAARQQGTDSDPQDTDGQGKSSFVVPAGSYQVFAEAPGYAVGRAEADVVRAGTSEVLITLKPAKVEVTTEKVVILEKVFFEFDSAKLVESSKPLLIEVADTLLAHPEIARIEIGGHTDSRGTDEYNRDLSQRRVETVRDYLIERGVEPERLVAKGYGESQLLDPADTEAAHALNRRVEFNILERTSVEE